MLRSRRTRRGAARAARAALDPDNASILVAGGGGVALEVTRRLKDMGAWVWQMQRSDSRRCARALRPPTCLESCLRGVCPACAAMAVTVGVHAHACIVWCGGSCRHMVLRGVSRHACTSMRGSSHPWPYLCFA